MYSRRRRRKRRSSSNAAAVVLIGASVVPVVEMCMQLCLYWLVPCFAKKKRRQRLHKKRKMYVENMLHNDKGSQQLHKGEPQKKTREMKK